MGTNEAVRTAVLASEIRYRRLFETARDGILILDAVTRKITDANPFMVELLGYSHAEFIGKELWEIGLLKDEEASKAAFAELQECGYIRYADLPLETKSGVRRELEFVSNVYTEGDRQVIQCNIRDITESKRAETQYRTLFDYAPDGIVIADQQSVYTDANASICAMLGYNYDELVGLHASDIVVASETQYIEPALSEILTGAHYHREWQFRRKNGSVFDAEVIATMMPGGNLLAMIRDITERRQAETKVHLLTEELEQRVAERTAQLEAVNLELESFSYSVSHDLRAPLRHINGFSQALLEDHADNLDDEGKGYLQEVRNASQEMAQLIDDILELARVTRKEMHRELVDLSALASEVIAELQKHERGRQVTTHIQAGLTTPGDHRLLKITLNNLLGNAWKFTSNQAAAEIYFGQEERDGRSVYFVRDNGAGFDMAYVSKLFGAFQRLHTASEFEGTGVGLAIVQRIIHRHGGRVWAEGARGQGANFYFTLAEGTEDRNGN
ncbi:MAG: PAS domain S-box protein [Pyrinomonadaceae bacterium]